jgi:hypothetical protein
VLDGEGMDIGHKQKEAMILEFFLQRNKIMDAS